MPNLQRPRRHAVPQGSAIEPLEPRRVPAVSVGSPQTIANGVLDHVQVGDLNRDGRDDLVYDQTSGTSGIYAALANPDGTFGTPTKVAPSGSFALADFNGDGNLDLLVAPPGQDFSLISGLGDGTFAHVAFPASVQAGLTVTVLGTGDFDGDGRLDVLTESFDSSTATTSATYTASVNLSHGDGTFTSVPVPNFVFGARNTVLADFNGDGKTDIAQAYNDDTYINLPIPLPGNSAVLGPLDYGSIQYAWGGGAFTDPISTFPSNPSTTVEPGLAADFNGDGHVDLLTLARARGAGTNAVLSLVGPGGVSLNVGDGTFRAPVALPRYNPSTTPSIDPGYRAAVAGDFDGDGRIDLLASSELTPDLSPQLFFLKGNGDGTFAAPVSIANLAEPNGLASLVKGDFNGDGQPDLVSISNLSYNANGPANDQVLAVMLNTTPPISGALDPASDTGISSHDNVTADTTPTFNGQGIPGAAVSLVLQSEGSPDFIHAGSTTVGADGSWSITTTPLAPGIYTVSATQSRPIDDIITVVLASGNNALVIDTTPPVVNAASIDPASGTVRVTLNAGVAGFYTSTLTDPSAFVLTNARGQVIPIAGVTLSPGGPIAGTVQLSARAAGRLAPGIYTLRLRASAIQDRAGNSLDGEFVRSLPSGEGHPGGDFVARFVTSRRFASPPRHLPLPRFTLARR